MPRKARTPIVEYTDYYAIELPGDGQPTESDRLTDQAIVIAYSRLPGRGARWQLRALRFDRDAWTRSGIRMWWAAHEVMLLGTDQLEREVPELCRAYDAPNAALPTILLVHRNTPLVAARRQMAALKQGPKTGGPHK